MSSDSPRRRVHLREMLSIDVRALAVFRVGLAVTLLFDLYYRSWFLTAHYTDLGVLPRDVANAYAGGLVGSFYMLGGSGWFVAILFGVAAILALMLLVGFETLLATFGSWAMLISVHSRNTHLLNAGDLLLGVLLLWSIFLPLGACASVDKWRGRERGRTSRTVFSAGTVAVLLQVVLVYLCTGLKKIDPAWCTEGTALYYALSLDQFATTLGHAMLGLPEFVLKISSIGTFWWEVAGWTLLFIPFWWARLRTTSALLYIGLHIGIGLTLHVGLFTLVCIIAWILFLPREFWDSVERTRVGGALADGFQWLICRVAGSPKVESEALTPNAQADVPAGGSAVDNWIVGALLLYVVWTNVGGFVEPLKVPKSVENVTEAIRINQNWAMFSPHPPAYDGWFLAPATLHDGSVVDLYSLVDGRSTEVDWEKPASAAMTFPTQRWRKYMTNIWMLEKHRKHVEHFGNYLRNAWNASHPADKQIDTMEVVMVVEYTMPDFEDPVVLRDLMYEWKGPEDFRVISNTESLDHVRKNVAKRKGNAVLTEPSSL